MGEAGARGGRAGRDGVREPVGTGFSGSFA